MKITQILTIAVAVVVSLGIHMGDALAAKAALTLDQFRPVETGMTLKEVEAVTGRKFVYVGISSTGAKRYRHYTTKSRTDFAPHAEVWIRDGRVTGTGQLGLR